MENWKIMAVALKNLKSEVQYSYSGDYPLTEEKFSTIDWVIGEDNGTALTTKTNPHSEITWSKVDTEIKRLQAEYDAQEYARKRQAEYPPFGDQLDMQYHDKINGTTTWQDTIKAVKDNHPKGG